MSYISPQPEQSSDEETDLLTALSNLAVSGASQAIRKSSATGFANVDLSSGTVGPGTTNEIAYFDSATTIKSLTTATYPSLTELSYVKGVTSAIQTQLNTKQASITGLDTQVLFFDGANTPAGDAGLTYNKTTNYLTVSSTVESGYILSKGAAPFVDLYDTDVNDFAGLEMRGATALRIYAPTGAKIRMMNNLDLQGVCVSSHFIPETDDSYDIGSSTKAWSGLFLGPDEVIHFNNISYISQGVGADNSLYLTPPSGYNVIITDPTSGIDAILSTASLATSGKTFTFPNLTGTFALGTGTINEIAYWAGANTLGTLAVATYPSLTELSYVKGVTSAIQTQLNARATTAGALTQFIGNGNWKVFYSDGSGDIIELALGADGTFLKSNGATSAPTFATPAGSGDVTKVGTPVNNQVGIWTGDGTLEGDAALTFDTTTDILTTVLITANTITANTGFVPGADDGAYLGQAGTAFSDLFLASGAVINFNSGNMTLTHTAGALTLAGGTLTLAENASVALDPAGSADGKYTGTTVTGTSGYTQAFGDCVYLDPTDSRWEACDANAAAGADGDSRGIVGIVVVAGTDGNSCTILLSGIIRADAKFPTFTVNNPIYVSETAGVVTQTQPATTDNVIRICGFALTADEMYWNPENDYITRV